MIYRLGIEKFWFQVFRAKDNHFLSSFFEFEFSLLYKFFLSK